MTGIGLGCITRRIALGPTPRSTARVVLESLRTDPTMSFAVSFTRCHFRLATKSCSVRTAAKGVRFDRASTRKSVSLRKR